MKISFSKNTIFLGALFAAVIVIGLIPIWTLHKAKYLWEEYLPHEKNLRDFRELNSSVFEQESSSRGFMLTNDAIYKNQFDQALLKTRTTADRLLERSSDFETKNEIMSLINKRLELSQTLMKLLEDKQTEHAHKLLESGKGFNLSKKIQAHTESLEESENRIVKKLLDEVFDKISMVNFMILCFCALTIAMILVFYIRLNSEIRIKSNIENELRSNQSELVNAKLKAEKSERAKSDFLANMSHEIRTPLNGVIGMASLLRTMNLGTEEAECVDDMKKSGQHLLTLINDILDFSKIESGKFFICSSPFSLPLIAQEIQSHFSIIAQEKGLNFVLKIDPQIPECLLGDAMRIKQVLINFISNAMKFTSSGTIGVSISKKIQLSDSAPNYRFEVSDTGIGISPQDLLKLFKPFTQADESTTRRFGGTGLGLAISKNLVELMNGQIHVDSVPDKGSVFWFEIPLMEASFASNNVRETINPMSLSSSITFPSYLKTTSSFRVLVADDNFINQKIETRMLERLGYKVDCVSNGQEAVENCRKFKYDLIFMDCLMPELNGYDATRAIRSQPMLSQMTPIVALTASALSGEREKCIAAGMSDHMSKPITIEVLAEISKKWLPIKSDHNMDQKSVNIVRLQALKHSIDDDQFLEELISNFEKSFPSYFDKLVEAIESNDLSKIEFSTHKIRGAADNICLMKISDFCIKIDELAQKGHASTELHSIALKMNTAMSLGLEELKQEWKKLS